MWRFRCVFCLASVLDKLCHAFNSPKLTTTHSAYSESVQLDAELSQEGKESLQCDLSTTQPTESWHNHDNHNYDVMCPSCQYNPPSYMAPFWPRFTIQDVTGSCEPQSGRGVVIGVEDWFPELDCAVFYVPTNTV